MEDLPSTCVNSRSLAESRAQVGDLQASLPSGDEGCGRFLIPLLNLSQPEQNTKLYRSYALQDGARGVLRHRGKSPRQAAFFFRNPEVTFHAAQLASLFLIYGLVGAASGVLESRYRVGSLESGTLLCQAYEAFLELHSPVSISFEHAWFLLLALARRDEVSVTRCDECGGLRLC